MTLHCWLRGHRHAAKERWGPSGTYDESGWRCPTCGRRVVKWTSRPDPFAPPQPAMRRDIERLESKIERLSCNCHEDPPRAGRHWVDCSHGFSDAPAHTDGAL